MPKVPRRVGRVRERVMTVAPCVVGGADVGAGAVVVTRWQATVPAGRSRSAGTSVTQRSTATGQRVWNRQPDGGSMRAGQVVAGQHDAAAGRAGVARVGHRRRRQQRLRVGVRAGAAKILSRGPPRRACRGTSPRPVGEVLDRGQVVGDEQAGEAEVALQVGRAG